MARDDVSEAHGGSQEEERLRWTLDSILHDYSVQPAGEQREFEYRRPRIAQANRRAVIDRERPSGSGDRPARVYPPLDRPPGVGRGRIAGKVVVLGAIVAVAVVAVVLLGTHHKSSSSSSSSAERATARAINLRPADVPGFSVHPRSHNATDNEIDARGQRCVGPGVGKHSGSLSVDSQLLAAGSGLALRQVSSNVTVEPSKSAVASDFALMHAGRVQACIAPAVDGATIATSHGVPVTINNVQTAALPAETHGTEDSYGIRVTMDMDAAGARIPMTLDVYSYAIGRDEVSLMTTTIGNRFPTETEQRLSSLLINRARAANGLHAATRAVPVPLPRAARSSAKATAPPPSRRAAPPSPTGADGVSNLQQGKWIARGVVISNTGGGALHNGDQIERIWFFQRQCRHGQCGVYWTRSIDTGMFTARAHGQRNLFTATFSNESAPCTSAASGTTVQGFGLLTSIFRLKLGPGPNRLSGTEHTYATTAACSALDRRIRWTAVRVAPGQATGTTGQQA